MQPFESNQSINQFINIKARDEVAFHQSEPEHGHHASIGWKACAQSLCVETELMAWKMCLVPRLLCVAEKLGSRGVLGWMQSGFSESAP